MSKVFACLNGMEPTTSIQVLRNQQKILRGLFRQLEIIGRRTPKVKKRVVDETLMMLEVYLDLEEEFIYPPLKSSTRERDREIANQFLGKIDEVRILIMALRRRRPDEENFNIGAINLITTAEECFDLESKEVFPAIENLLGSFLDEMGPRIEDRRDKLIASPRYKKVA